MKTLLQINVVVNYGSTGRIAEEIGETAINNGWKSIIAFGRYERPSLSQLIKIGTDWDIKMHGIQTRLFDRHGLGSKLATQKLIEQIKAIKPDVIHLHNIHGYYINIEVLFKFLAAMQIPVVWTLHDCWPFTGHCVYFEFVGCEKWQTQCNNCPQTRTYPESIFLDRSTQNFNLKEELFTSLQNLTLVPVSDWLAKLLKQSFLKNFPIKVINNGIDIETFKPISSNNIRAKFKIQSKFIILGVTNTWNKRKGLQDFIELSFKLDLNYQIILVGLSKNQINTLPDRIVGIERTDSVKELAELYAASDVFVNPTSEDNFPTTNLEALACGTPVITYNTGGSPEAIDEQTGVVVEKNNINDLHAAIIKLQKYGKMHYSEACRKRAMQLYNKADRFNDYIRLYESLLN